MVGLVIGHTGIGPSGLWASWATNYPKTIVREMLCRRTLIVLQPTSFSKHMRATLDRAVWRGLRKPVLISLSPCLYPINTLYLVSLICTSKSKVFVCARLFLGQERELPEVPAGCQSQENMLCLKSLDKRYAYFHLTYVCANKRYPFQNQLLGRALHHFPKAGPLCKPRLWEFSMHQNLHRYLLWTEHQCLALKSKSKQQCS